MKHLITLLLALGLFGAQVETVKATRYGLPIEEWRGVPEASSRGITWFTRKDGEGPTSQRIGLSVEKSEACGIVVRKVLGYGRYITTYHFAAAAQDINTHAGVWLRDDSTVTGDAEIDAPEFYANDGDINDANRLKVGVFRDSVRLGKQFESPLPPMVLWRSTIVYGPHDTHTLVEGLRGKDWIPVDARSFHIESNGKATLRIMLRHLKPGFAVPRTDRAEAKLTITDIKFEPEASAPK